MKLWYSKYTGQSHDPLLSLPPNITVCGLVWDRQYRWSSTSITTHLHCDTGKDASPLAGMPQLYDNLMGHPAHAGDAVRQGEAAHGLKQKASKSHSGSLMHQNATIYQK